MAQLSAGPPKGRPFDGGSQLSEQMKRTLGDLGADFPKLRKVCARKIFCVLRAHIFSFAR